MCKLKTAWITDLTKCEASVMKGRVINYVYYKIDRYLF